jgi:hypothetical protein
MVVDGDGKHVELAESNVTDLNGVDTVGNNGNPVRYQMRGNSIVLLPTPDASNFVTLRLWYFRRPNQLVGTSAVLTSTTLTGLVTFNGTKPSTITTSTPVDVVQGSPPYDSLGDSLTPSAVASGYVTFSANVTGAVAGDYVCLAGQSPVIQLPDEFYNLLCLRTARSLLPANGDPAVAANVQRLLDEANGDIFGAIAATRNEGGHGYIGVGGGAWD